MADHTGSTRKVNGTPLHTIYPAANPGGTQKGLELVKREGARHVFDHTNADHREQILKATGGRGWTSFLRCLPM
jgi:hypothetical protein